MRWKPGVELAAYQAKSARFHVRPATPICLPGGRRTGNCLAGGPLLVDNPRILRSSNSTACLSVPQIGFCELARFRCYDQPMLTLLLQGASHDAAPPSAASSLTLGNAPHKSRLLFMGLKRLVAVAHGSTCPNHGAGAASRPSSTLFSISFLRPRPCSYQRRS